MSASKIKVQAIVSAGTKKAWDYYTKPVHITKWNFASEDWHCPSAVNDMRVGGRYSSRMEAKDGSFGFDFEAVYDEVTDQKKFTYTMTDGRRAMVDFEEMGDRTLVTITFDAEKDNPKDMQRDGWQAILNNYKNYVENN